MADLLLQISLPISLPHSSTRARLCRVLHPSFSNFLRLSSPPLLVPCAPLLHFLVSSFYPRLVFLQPAFSCSSSRLFIISFASILSLLPFLSPACLPCSRHFSDIPCIAFVGSPLIQRIYFQKTIEIPCTHHCLSSLTPYIYSTLSEAFPYILHIQLLPSRTFSSHKTTPQFPHCMSYITLHH